MNDDNNSNTDPIIAEVAVVNRNPYKALAIILSVIVVGLVSAVFYLLLQNAEVATTDSSDKNTKSYTVNLTTDALATQPAEQGGVPVLTINDLSDSFTDKYFAVSEWGLKIKTKYADLLEYAFMPVKKDADGSTPYPECNGDYLQCDSVLAIRIKEKYVDVAKEEQKAKAAYGDSAEAYKDNPEDRTIAYIYQDNRSLSQNGTETVRYWSNDAFKTDLGNRATLLFGQTKAGGEDDNGFGLCGVELNISLDSDTPCDAIFLSLYRFDASAL